MLYPLVRLTRVKRFIFEGGARSDRVSSAGKSVNGCKSGYRIVIEVTGTLAVSVIVTVSSGLPATPSVPQVLVVTSQTLRFPATVMLGMLISF